jgi:hypothetical protein
MRLSCYCQNSPETKSSRTQGQVRARARNVAQNQELRK